MCIDAEINFLEALMTFIKCKDLVLGYNNKAVSAPLTFEVNEGDYLCIIGENGSGKSTLIKTLLGLQEKVSGEINFYFNQNEVEEKTKSLRKLEIGYLPQRNEIQKDFPATVWEVVLSGTLGSCGFSPFYSKAQKKLALEKMEQMEITAIKNKSFHRLSGGQQQRVLLARALCAAENILLLDEPVTGLDPKVTEELYEIIKDLNKKGITIIMVSHDMSSINYSTNVLRLGQKDFFFGTKDEYLKNLTSEDLSKWNS